MATPWEDVRDVLVRVGFGSPRPSTSSDEIIRVTRERPRGRGADGQRQKSDASASSSRRRRRNTRTSNSDTNSPTVSMLDAGVASTPLPIPRATNSNSSTPADRQVRISTTAMSSRARNRARGVRPVHQSPSQLLLDLSPVVGDAEGARQQGAVVNKGDGDDVETAAALFAEALSPIVPIPRRTSSMVALSDYGEQTNGSDVDLSEVHDMVDQIQRDLTEDLREISTSINNYDDNTNANTNIASGDTTEDDGGSIEKAQGGHKGSTTNGPEAVSRANDESSVDSSSSTSADSTGNEVEAKAIAAGEAYQSVETLEAIPPENDEKTAQSQPSSCHCTCDCHKIPSSQNDIAEAEKVQRQAMTPPKYKFPIPTRESADSPARALCQTADEIQRRAEVAGVLSCMITDVEQAHWLASDLRHRSKTENPI